MVIFKATKRAIVSAPPPGVNGMRMRTGLLGRWLPDRRTGDAGDKRSGAGLMAGAD